MVMVMVVMVMKESTNEREEIEHCLLEVELVGGGKGGRDGLMCLCLCCVVCVYYS